MADYDSAIRSWDPAVGCRPVSESCKYCIAEGRITVRREVLNAEGHWNGRVTLLPGRLMDPFEWTSSQAVFVAGNSDLFYEEIPEEYVAAVMHVIANCPDHLFYVATKRPENARAWFEAVGGARSALDVLASCASRYCLLPGRKNGIAWPPTNLVLMTSTENQRRFEERWPSLARCAVTLRALSMEPLLGPIDLSLLKREEKKPDWLVIGAEVGAKARETKPEWVNAIVDQCREIKIKVLVKDSILGVGEGYAVKEELPMRATSRRPGPRPS
jgi:protein gp37